MVLASVFLMIRAKDSDPHIPHCALNLLKRIMELSFVQRFSSIFFELERADTRARGGSRVPSPLL